MKYTTNFILLIVFASMLSGCFDDNDDVLKAKGTKEINDFIWKGMNAFYLYKKQVNDLRNDRFPNDQEYAKFLDKFSSSNQFFDELLTKETVTVDGKKFKVDDFSFIVDDYVELEKAFDGIIKSNGMEFGLVRYSGNSSLVFGYVRYILPNTDAQNKGVKRGDIFTTINGTEITVNNYRELLNKDSYTIGLATIEDKTLTPTGKSIALSKVEYTENPVYISKTITVGEKPVGYLMYNSFTGDFDSKLNEAFGKFKADGVTDLILDLRYNGGGSVESAIDLASMITGQFSGEVFSTEQWNDDRQKQLGSINKFDNKTRNDETINSLNLSRVYFITTRGSASASELVISGLTPYIQTQKIGDTTRGKFQASITLYDSENFGRQKADPSHTYAIQPLVIKSINSVGFTDYYAGIAPNVLIEEDVANMGVLGDKNEPLLKAAIDDILGVNKSAKNYNTKQIDVLWDSKRQLPNYERMYKEIDAPTIKQLLW